MSTLYVPGVLHKNEVTFIMGLDDKSYVNILLEKYINGSISSLEKQKFFDLISYTESEEVAKEYILSHLNSFEVDDKISDEFDSDKIFNKVLSELKLEKVPGSQTSILNRNGKPGLRRIAFRVAGIAAGLIVAFLLGELYITKVKMYTPRAAVATTFSEIRAPLGSNSEVSLPDGTQVILNAGSILRYRSDYNTDNRDISLIGEGYFKVAKNIEIPLKVSAGNINVKAVGTEFNIKAYEDEGTIETTLVEGKVEISQSGLNEDIDKYVDLNPNQKAIYIKETKDFTIAEIKNTVAPVSKPVRTIYDNILISPKVDISQVVAWTQGKLIFRGESLEKLCVELQRKYDVTFIFGDEEIKKFRFSGVLLDETLEQVLNVIELTAPIKHYVEGKSVFMRSDREQLNDFSKHLK